jgi:hypothetical protein
MPANGRWDLIRHLKVKGILLYLVSSVFLFHNCHCKYHGLYGLIRDHSVHVMFWHLNVATVTVSFIPHCIRSGIPSLWVNMHIGVGCQQSCVVNWNVLFHPTTAFYKTGFSALAITRSKWWSWLHLRCTLRFADLLKLVQSQGWH